MNSILIVYQQNDSIWIENRIIVSMYINQNTARMVEFMRRVNDRVTSGIFLFYLRSEIYIYM